MKQCPSVMGSPLSGRKDDDGMIIYRKRDSHPLAQLWQEFDASAINASASASVSAAVSLTCSAMRRSSFILVTLSFISAIHARKRAKICFWFFSDDWFDIATSFVSESIPQ